MIDDHDDDDHHAHHNDDNGDEESYTSMCVIQLPQAEGLHLLLQAAWPPGPADEVSLSDFFEDESKVVHPVKSELMLSMVMA